MQTKNGQIFTILTVTALLAAVFSLTTFSVPVFADAPGSSSANGGDTATPPADTSSTATPPDTSSANGGTVATNPGGTSNTATPPDTSSANGGTTATNPGGTGNTATPPDTSSANGGTTATPPSTTGGSNNGGGGCTSNCTGGGGGGSATMPDTSSANGGTTATNPNNTGGGCTSNCGGGGGTGGNGPIITTGGGGGGGGNGPISGSGGSLGTTTACSPYMTQYIFPDGVKSSAEISKLQTFLKEVEKLPVTVTGLYDAQTIAAVSAFQARYTTDVLTPWGSNIPSGIVYISTLKKINSIVCNLPILFSQAELATMQSFKDRFAFSGGTNGNLSPLQAFLLREQAARAQAQRLAAAKASANVTLTTGKSATSTGAGQNVAVSTSTPNTLLKNTASVFNSISIGWNDVVGRVLHFFGK